MKIRFGNSLMRVTPDLNRIQVRVDQGQAAQTGHRQNLMTKFGYIKQRLLGTCFVSS